METLSSRQMAVTAGVSYLIIFVMAIFGNFFMLEELKSDPLSMVNLHPMMVRFGVMAFIITVVFDVVVAWALFRLFQGHRFNLLSTLFRMMHAAIMGTGIFALALVFDLQTEPEIMRQVETFEAIWLIGLLFFGIHLILLGRILKNPRLISLFLIFAGMVYILDTAAHFLLTDYSEYAGVFLALVAIPSIIGELSFTGWLLVRAGERNK